MPEIFIASVYNKKEDGSVDVKSIEVINRTFNSGREAHRQVAPLRKTFALGNLTSDRLYKLSGRVR